MLWIFILVFVMINSGGGGGVIWSPADFVSFPTDIDMISL